MEQFETPDALEAADHERDRADAVRRADDTGMISGEVRITQSEINDAEITDVDDAVSSALGTQTGSEREPF